jgi:hypothetical protein
MKFFIAVCQSVWLWCKPTGIDKELPNVEWFLLLVLGGCDGQLDEEAGMVGDGSAESSHHRITQALHRRCCHCLVCSSLACAIMFLVVLIQGILTNRN